MTIKLFFYFSNLGLEKNTMGRIFPSLSGKIFDLILSSGISEKVCASIIRYLKRYPLKKWSRVSKQLFRKFGVLTLKQKKKIQKQASIVRLYD